MNIMSTIKEKLTGTIRQFNIATMFLLQKEGSRMAPVSHQIGLPILYDLIGHHLDNANCIASLLHDAYLPCHDRNHSPFIYNLFCDTTMQRLNFLPCTLHEGKQLLWSVVQ